MHVKGTQIPKSFTRNLTIFEDRRQNNSLNNLVAEEAAENAWEQIQNFLQATKRIDFLMLIVDLLIAMGYYIKWTAPLEKNHGQIDIVAFADPLGVKGTARPHSS